MGRHRAVSFRAVICMPSRPAAGRRSAVLRALAIEQLFPRLVGLVALADEGREDRHVEDRLVGRLGRLLQGLLEIDEQHKIDTGEDRSALLSPVTGKGVYMTNVGKISNEEICAYKRFNSFVKGQDVWMWHCNIKHKSGKFTEY